MPLLRNPRFWVCCAVVAIACLILSPGLAAPRFPLGVRRIVASLAAGLAFVFMVATWVAARQLSPRIGVPLGATAFVIACLTAVDAWTR
jgi:hypothetical protein